MYRYAATQTTEYGTVLSFLNNTRKALLPNSRDNFKQAAIKLLFLISIAVFIFTAADMSVLFYKTVRQERLETEAREIWHNNELTLSERFTVLRESNADIKAWLNIDGTEIDYPVYKTADNEFYIDHNREKKRDYHGALFFDCDDVIDADGSDKKLIIYGNNVDDGSMFGTLENYRSYDFYKEHPSFTLTSRYGEKNYKVFSVMLLDAENTEDFDVLKEKFSDNNEFFNWYCEAYSRSVITIELAVDKDDEIVVLMTDANDFDGARLAVLARKQRAEEAYSNTAKSFVNPNPKHPVKWYKTKGIEYPH